MFSKIFMEMKSDRLTAKTLSIINHTRDITIMGVLDFMGPSQASVRKTKSMATGSIESILQEKLLERIMGEQKEPNRGREATQRGS